MSNGDPNPKFGLEHTVNICAVCANPASNLVIIHQPTGQGQVVLNTAQALNAAAWIVNLLDPERQQFNALADAVRDNA